MRLRAHERHNKQAVVVAPGGVLLRNDAINEVVALLTEDGVHEVPDGRRQ